MSEIERCERCEDPIPKGHPRFWADEGHLCAECAVELLRLERNIALNSRQGDVGAFEEIRDVLHRGEWNIFPEVVRAVELAEAALIRLRRQ